MNKAKAQYGAGLLEVMMVLAITALAAPFIYMRIANTARDLGDLSYARTIYGWRGPVAEFILENQSKFPDDAVLDFDDMSVFKNAPSDSRVPYAGYLDKYASAGNVQADAYIAFHIPDGAMRAANIARLLGPDAAVSEQGGIAYSTGGAWNIASDLFRPGDLVYRVKINIEKDTDAFLHRTFAGDETLSSMARNLNMSGKAVENINKLAARDLNVRDIATLTLDVGTLSARTVLFASGAVLSNPGISALQVMGDVSGFKTMAAMRFLGDSRASVVADRATVEGEIFVEKDFFLRTDLLRSVSAFTYVSAGVLSAQYLTADILTFAPGMGLSVSRDFLNSYSEYAIQIGKWDGVESPEFSELSLHKYGSALSRAMPIEEFKDIMSAGWK